MQEIQLGVIEAKFADMIWAHEPVNSSELVKLSAVEFNWKRTTTHTVIRRLCDKGLFRNDKGVIRTVISRQDFYANQSRKYVDEAFNGSLPAFIAAFIAAFTKYSSLTSEEADEIRKMIDDAEENADG